MIQINSKLPNQAVTIFSTMTALANRLHAINLAQGFPDFAPPAALTEALCQASLAGQHQYSPGDGLLSLRENIAEQVLQRNTLSIDPITAITITSGATIALYCAIQACIHSGDEVIIFDPSYDSYAPSVTLAGGRPIHIALQAPDFSVDWQQLSDLIGPRTRMIIVNTPHNPTGTVWQKEDWQQLIALIEDKNIVVLSDEVYEHLVFDQAVHYSALDFPELRERSFVVGSFGKSFHVTGWKTGYCIAAPQLMTLFRQVYQFASFCGVTPIQYALDQFMRQHPEHLSGLSDFYQQKRDQFLAGIANTPFVATATQGTFFQTVDYSALRPDLDDLSMCHYLAEQYKVVAIPISVFYKNPPSDARQIRFCFAKQAETLDLACQRLRQCQT